MVDRTGKVVYKMKTEDIYTWEGWNGNMHGSDDREAPVGHSTSATYHAVCVIHQAGILLKIQTSLPSRNPQHDTKEILYDTEPERGVESANRTN